MPPRTRRAETASAERLRSLTRRAYLATAGHLDTEPDPDDGEPGGEVRGSAAAAHRLDDEEPRSASTARTSQERRRAEFDDIVTGPGPAADGRGGADQPGGAAQPGDAGRPIRWRVSIRAAVAAIIVLAALTGVVVARALTTAAPSAVPLPAEQAAAVTTVGAPAGSGEPADGPTPGPSRGASTDPPSASPVAEPAPTEVVVHVAGAVQEPGIVSGASGVRVADVIELAGGPVPEAELGAINLAREVTDGEQVYVPVAGETQPGASAGAAPADGTPDVLGADAPAALIDLNSAGQAALETLPGVGPAIAQRILDWRRQNGGFHSVDELTEVSGIGPKTMEQLRPLVAV